MSVRDNKLEEKESFAYRASQFVQNHMYCKCAVNDPVYSDHSYSYKILYCNKCKLIIKLDET
jgi:hypothetical protein